MVRDPPQGRRRISCLMRSVENGRREGEKREDRGV